MKRMTRPAVLLKPGDGTAPDELGREPGFAGQPRRIPATPRRAKISGVSGASPKNPLEALGALMRAQRMSADLSLRELAERTNVSNAYLSELERGLHEPSLRVLRAIASALGMPLELMLASAGVLEDAEGDRPADVRETEAAILRDRELSEPQRTALLSVYRSFVQLRPPR
jgi:transcriptional regulator with XRE-family HTH domain